MNTPPSSPGVGYRFINVGEDLLPTDEFFDCISWNKFDRVGYTVGRRGSCPFGWYRRKVEKVNLEPEIPQGWYEVPAKRVINKDNKFWTGITWQECGKNLDGILHLGGIKVIAPIRQGQTKIYYQNLREMNTIQPGDEWLNEGGIWVSVNDKAKHLIGNVVADEGRFRRPVKQKVLKIPDIHVSTLPESVEKALKHLPMVKSLGGHKDPLMNPPPFKIICVNEEHRKFVLKFLFALGYRFHIYGNEMNVDGYCETFKFDDYPNIIHSVDGVEVGKIAVSSAKSIAGLWNIPTIHLHEVQTYLAPDPVVMEGEVYRTSKGNKYLVGYGVIVNVKEGYIHYTTVDVKELKSMIRAGEAVLIKTASAIIV